MPHKDSEARRLWQRQWNRQMNEVWRAQAVEMLGGKWVKCGYNENIHAFDIDHVEPQLKNRGTYANGAALARAVAKRYISTEGLQLLCANCHAIKTRTIDKKLFANYQLDDRPKLAQGGIVKPGIFLVGENGIDCVFPPMKETNASKTGGA